MKPRSIAGIYQTAARVWLSAALFSVLLPEQARLGVWLPLHLALAGAATVAICGAMQTFVLAMTAAKSPPGWQPAMQFGLVNIGVLLIAVGYPSGWRWAVASGGLSLFISIVVLERLVARAWRKALNRRHVLPVAMYRAAAWCLLIGAAFGVLVGTHVVKGVAWSSVRASHVVLNVLGWVSLTIAGTLTTLLPTVLRVRMPAWRGRVTGLSLCLGVILVAAGVGLRSHAVLAAGGIAYAVGAAGVAWMALLVLSTPHKWPRPISAKHLLCGLCWFLFGSVALGVEAVRGLEAFVSFRPVFLVAFVGGWIVQTLLGAWLFLLPMWRAGHPEERRRSWAAVEFLGGVQLVGLNLGLMLMAVRFSTPSPGTLGAVGTGLALGCAALALVKAWFFRLIARGPVVTARARSMWWAEE